MNPAQCGLPKSGVFDDLLNLIDRPALERFAEKHGSDLAAHGSAHRYYWWHFA